MGLRNHLLNFCLLLNSQTASTSNNLLSSVFEAGLDRCLKYLVLQPSMFREQATQRREHKPNSSAGALVVLKLQGLPSFGLRPIAAESDYLTIALDVLAPSQVGGLQIMLRNRAEALVLACFWTPRKPRSAREVLIWFFTWIYPFSALHVQLKQYRGCCTRAPTTVNLRSCLTDGQRILPGVISTPVINFADVASSNALPNPGYTPQLIVLS